MFLIVALKIIYYIHKFIQHYWTRITTIEMKITKLASSLYSLFEYRDGCEGQTTSLVETGPPRANIGTDHTRPPALPL